VKANVEQMVSDDDFGEIGIRTIGIFPTPIAYDSPFVRVLLRVVYFRRDVEKPSDWSPMHGQMGNRVKPMRHTIVRPAGP